MEILNKTYVDIVEEYKTCKSITKIAKKLKVSEERVRRTLITEGLWTSRSAEPIIRLFNNGKTVPEIADILTISEKTVQSYIPYSRGMYGGDRSETALRSEEYRDRMRKAVEEMNCEINLEHIPEEKLPEIITNRRWKYEDQKLKESEIGKLPWEKTKDGAGDERKYVYQLRFDLTSGFLYGAREDYEMTTEEREEFLRLAKAKKGISRTVLVPGEMSLHAMHYMIQRLFGWQNEHLHRFCLPKDVFYKLTDNRIGKWLEQCGVLLRFPTGDNIDIYWDDDYEADRSVKSWLRSKYRKSYASKAISESFIASLSKIEDFNRRFFEADNGNKGLNKESTLEDLRHTVCFDSDFNTILERLRLCDLFICSSEGSEKLIESWKEKTSDNRETVREKIQILHSKKEIVHDLDEAIDELKNWRAIRSNVESAIIRGRRTEVEEKLGTKAENVIRAASDAIPMWEEKVFKILNSYNPMIYPFLDTMYYLYDFGDDWCVKITCEKRYKRMSGWDFPDKNGYIIIKTKNHIDELKTYRYFDECEVEITGEERSKLVDVDIRKMPLCIKSDGISLVEDPGGIYGFYHMLQTLAGDNLEEKKSMKEWARSLGWTGRVSNPKNML